MKFALVDSQKIEASKGLKGLRPSCGSELIAKCGTRKINHWAHKGARNCDPWWEPETEWHRNWKDKFPIEWQEKIQFDEHTNEKHIADIFTENNLVVEFQHSHIDAKERQAREKFYKNMVWVVDGTRLQRDYPRFQKRIGEFKLTSQRGVYAVEFPDEVFPKNWLESSVPVIFDYCGLAENETDQCKSLLWCIVPQINSLNAIIVAFQKSDFVQIVKSRGQLFISHTGQESGSQVQPQLYTKLNNRVTTHRGGPLINWIEKKQATGKWRPRKRW